VTTGYSQSLTAGHMDDFVEIAGIECVLVDDHTRLRELKQQLWWSEIYYRYR
jgi:L-arabinose isomerase